MSAPDEKVLAAARGLELPELRLCRAAGAKLRAAGWRVVSEVPFFERSIDLVATKDGLVFAVEAKTSFTKRLQSQVFGVAWHVDFAVAVVASRPKPEGLDWARHAKVGVWRITGAGEVEVLVQPAAIGRAEDIYRRRLLERAQQMPEDVDGGQPCLRGQGPAVDVEAAVAAYRAEHPSATWADVYAAVPNHYASAASMASAAFSNRRRRALRERIREAKQAATQTVGLDAARREGGAS